MQKKGNRTLIIIFVIFCTIIVINQVTQIQVNQTVQLQEKEKAKDLNSFLSGLRNKLSGKYVENVQGKSIWGDFFRIPIGGKESACAQQLKSIKEDKKKFCDAIRHELFQDAGERERMIRQFCSIA